MFTIQQLKNIHCVFNQQVFGGRLSDIPIGIKRNNSSYGFYWWGFNIKNPRIILTRELMQEEDVSLILAVLAHEMCHQAQAELAEKSLRIVDKEMDDHTGMFPVYAKMFRDRFPRHKFTDEIV